MCFHNLLKAAMAGTCKMGKEMARIASRELLRLVPNVYLRRNPFLGSEMIPAYSGN
jgi:hypothetical protein